MNSQFKAFLSKYKISIFLFPLVIYFLFSKGEYTLLDYADLIIHEAGHFFFRVFGEFLYMAGGTMMQIVFPLFIALYFLKNLYLPGFQIFLFWLAHNLINISVYAADAETRVLPLLGHGKHDWYYLLSKLGILSYAEIVGLIFFLLSIIVFLLCLMTPLILDRYAGIS
jgi:hypothetical protein